jgi:hypothetical protein
MSTGIVLYSSQQSQSHGYFSMCLDRELGSLSVNCHYSGAVSALQRSMQPTLAISLGDDLHGLAGLYRCSERSSPGCVHRLNIPSSVGWTSSEAVACDVLTRVMRGYCQQLGPMAWAYSGTHCTVAFLDVPLREQRVLNHGIVLYEINFAVFFDIPVTTTTRIRISDRRGQREHLIQDTEPLIYYEDGDYTPGFIVSCDRLVVEDRFPSWLRFLEIDGDGRSVRFTG